jgi:hypothetical protein
MFSQKRKSQALLFVGDNIHRSCNALSFLEGCTLDECATSSQLFNYCVLFHSILCNLFHNFHPLCNLLNQVLNFEFVVEPSKKS